MTTFCDCGKPTRDGAYFCEDCADQLAKALGDVTWLTEELETTISRQKGGTYNETSKGAETPSPVNWTASEARTHLRGVLVSWVLFCRDEHVRNSSPNQDALPGDTLPDLARWLLWRVDGLSLLDIGPSAVEQITSATAHCHRLIDSPPVKQYLGTCLLCDGRQYAAPRGTWATCEACDAKTLAQPIRDAMVQKLDDRLCSAAEIADLSSYLGLKANREQVRKRVNQWHKRGRIVREHAFADEPVFRFGIVRRLLEAEDAAS